MRRARWFGVTAAESIVSLIVTAGVTTVLAVLSAYKSFLVGPLVYGLAGGACLSLIWAAFAGIRYMQMAETDREDRIREEEAARVTTENVRMPPNQIDITLQHGPFKHLDGSWRFIPLSDSACTIEFRLHYEFSSKLLEKMVGPVFHYIANSLVDAFIQRAEKVYTNT